MAEPVDQAKLKAFLLPAGAAALVVILIAVLVSQSQFAPQPVPAAADAGKVAPAGSGDSSSEGMVTKLPELSDPAWKEIGEGLKIWDVKEGEGPACPPGASVNAHYIGWTTDGKSFDSSISRGKPSEFSLGGVVKGWSQGIPGMKPGGIRRLYIPYQLGYGESGRPPSIPPRAPLVFEVKLVSFR